MDRDWRTATVTELQEAGILLVEDGNHGEYRPRPDEFVAKGVAFVRAADMDAGCVLFESASKINEAARRRITKGIGAPGDVLLSHKGTVGKVALVPHDAPPFVCSPQTTFWRTLDSSVLDRRFLHVFLRSPLFHRQLGTRSGETDMAPYVSLTSQRGLRVTLPPIEAQLTIADILGGLDDKIELNRRMNETLEAMARALFKSWFVDFDAVRAKAEGRVPHGMDTTTAKLFPSEFEESELGKIPRGWQLVSLAEACELNPPRRLTKGTDAPYVEMASLPTAGHRPSGWPLRAAGSGARFKNGDTLLARITPCLENGKTGYVDFLKEGVVGWGSTEYIVLRPRAPLPPEWGYLLARDPVFREFAAKKMEGTSGRQRISADALGRFVVARPSRTIGEQFGDFVRELLSCMGANQGENVTLASLRDALLPRLLSGELLLKEAERLIAGGE